MNDKIADMIIRIKNAGVASKPSVLVSYSKMKMEIAELLKKEGYVKEVSKKGKKVTKFIDIALVYENGKPKIKGVDRLSKFSRRVYKKVKEIKPIKYGYGMTVLTTPRGILTDKEAKKENVGGEALFKIW